MTKINNSINSPYLSIQEFINRKAYTTISYQNLSYTQPFSDIIFPIKNILEDYIEYFKDKAIEVTFTNDEFLTYKYKPRLLSRYIYGTTELFFIILAINGMASEKEFSKKTIKLIPSDILSDMIQSIYNAEHQNIESYNNRLMKKYLDSKK